MTQPDENSSFQLQAAFVLEGFQQDLFDAGETVDGVAVAAAEEVINDQDPDGLFPLDQLPTLLANATERNPALRLLHAQELDELVRVDAASCRERSADDPPAQLEVLVQLEAAGHALLVTSTIEREIRRCERVAKRLVTSGRGDATVTQQLIHDLATAPQPLGIKNDGLRLTNVKILEDGRLSVTMTEPPVPYLSLARWPRFVIAFATSAIADARFAFVAGSGREWEIRLPPTRLKAIAGGVPHGALEVRLSGWMGDIRTRL